jgi:Ca2+-binding RTX toxin-like protein
MLRAISLSVLVLAIAPAAACAATAEVRSVASPSGSGVYPQVVFTGAPGEANRVSGIVDLFAAQTTFHDDAASISAGAGCMPIDTHTVRCNAAITPLVLFDVGDGNDAVRAPDNYFAGGIVVNGGDGDDVLQGTGTLNGGPGSDTLVGGPADDTLNGGAGADVLHGQDGPDVLSGDGDGAGVEASVVAGSSDILDGGPGRDFASYEGRRTAVHANLNDGTATVAGERDRFLGIESLRGGRGNDTLLGNGIGNTIEGGPGRDVLHGGDGDDVLDGGSAADKLFGGRDSDHLVSSGVNDESDGASGNDYFEMTADPRHLVCGSGVDVLLDRALSGLQVDGCEQVVAGYVTASTTPKLSGATLSVPLTCQGATYEHRVTACVVDVSFSLRRPGIRALRLGSTSRTLQAGQTRIFRLRLSAAEHRAISHATHGLIELALGGHTTENTPVPGTRKRVGGRWRVTRGATEPHA